MNQIYIYIYINNNYIFGIPLLKIQKECVKVTSKIMDHFEKINKLPNDAIFENQNQAFSPEENGSFFTFDQHLVILRNPQKTNLISDICAIIECDIDSDYLFTYIPISPQTSLALVKSEYYDNWSKYLNVIKNKNGNLYQDSYLSVIFEKREYILVNSYSFVRSAVHMQEAYLKIKKYSKVRVKIQTINENEVRQFNSIICEDGKKILYTNKKELDHALKNKLDTRYIKIY